MEYAINFFKNLHLEAIKYNGAVITLIGNHDFYRLFSSYPSDHDVYFNNTFKSLTDSADFLVERYATQDNLNDFGKNFKFVVNNNSLFGAAIGINLKSLTHIFHKDNIFSITEPSLFIL